MLRLRDVAFTMVALTLVPAAVPASQNHEAEYVGGTAKNLEERTLGTLDLSDARTLKFRYEGKVYELPYANVRSVRFSNFKGTQRKIVHVPVPRVPFRGGHTQMVELKFQDDAGAVGTASFRISGATRALVESELNERVDAQRSVAANPKKSKGPEEWWGDKAWKTNRNKASWPDPTIETTATSAGTK